MLSSSELEAAIGQLQARRRGGADHTLANFRNGLSLFLSSISESPTPTNGRVYAPDTVELFAQVNYSTSDLEAFSFFPFLLKSYPLHSLEGSGDKDEFASLLFRLDRTIGHRIFFSKEITPILLDSYTEEIASRFYHDKGRSRRSVISGKELGSLERNLIDEFINYLGTSEFRNEPRKTWQRLRSSVLHKIHADTVDAIDREIDEKLKFFEFFRDANYSYLRSSQVLQENGANRSRGFDELLCESFGYDGFDFVEFKSFLSSSQVRDETRKLRGSLDELFRVERNRPKPDRYDVSAIVQSHFLNEFLLNHGVPVSLVIISRSQSVLNVVASLPDPRVNVDVRHPIFTPELFNLTDEAINSMRPILSTALSFLDDDANRLSLVPGPNEARKHARLVVNYLNDIVGTKSTFATSEAISERKKEQEDFVEEGHYGGNDSEDVDFIVRTLNERIDSGVDPSSVDAWKEIRSIVRRQIKLADGLGAQSGQTIRARVIALGDDNDFTGVSTHVVRLVEPYFGVALHMYSGFLDELIGESDVDLLHDNQERSTYSHDLYDRGFASTTLSTGLGFALQKASEVIDPIAYAFTYRDLVERRNWSSSEVDELLSGLDAVLLVAVLTSARGQDEIGIALCNEVLRPVTELLRVDSRPLGRLFSDKRVFLAFREFYLLRHHCERRVAMRHTTIAFASRRVAVGNEVSGHFARAQRDLDFSVAMHEQAARVTLRSALPAVDEFSKSRKFSDTWGQGFLYTGQRRNARNLITHVNGWLDCFLVNATNDLLEFPVGSENEDAELNRRRSYLWAMAGFAKETSLLAEELKQDCLARRRVNGSQMSISEVRYGNHLEARLLQCALLTFVASGVFSLSSVCVRNVRRYRRPSSDQLLAFRQWRPWWSRYTEIRNDIGMQIRMHHIVDSFCGFLTSAESLETDLELLASEELKKQQELVAEHSTRFTMVKLSRAFQHQLKWISEQGG